MSPRPASINRESIRPGVKVNTQQSFIAFAAMLLFCIPPVMAQEQTPEEMKREIEAEFERLRQADEAKAQPQRPPPKKAEAPQAKPREPARQAAPARAVVQNSGWDGSVYQVERYLENVLKDPDSYDGIEWSKVMPSGSGYVVRHKYRARNSFGGMVIENRIFVLDADGNVVGSQIYGK